ncbi:MAG: cobalamin-dependent protein [Deltaproteobacteria bacterium]|nr:cobalamin-dependent protein [Deltaproteobacteria bacterium]
MMPSPSNPSLLLINPWIYDFAAYDFFARPLGLLHLAGFLESCGFEITLLDCLGAPAVRSGAFGTGRFPKVILPTPPPLHGLPRRYGRYGISESEFRNRLARLPEPAAILVTSLMTYWYPGVAAAIAIARQYFPRTPVILGGIYATLCPDHARGQAGADIVIQGHGDKACLSYLADFTGIKVKPDDESGDFDVLPRPPLHLLPHLPFIPLLTSRGCPFQCDYCASRLLQPRFAARRPQAVVEELLHWQDSLGLMDVAFYDDALLYQADSHLLVILEELARRGRNFRFHTPNAVHARFITLEVARWLKRSRFATLRLGVETTSTGLARLDRKLAAGELEEALAHLKEAGFAKREIGVYLLEGLPEQDDRDLEASIRRVHALGATPVLAQYSPIPGTALWPTAVAASRYNLEADPIFHNPSIFPCWPEFSWERVTRLKRLAQGE